MFAFTRDEIVARDKVSARAVASAVGRLEVDGDSGSYRERVAGRARFEPHARIEWISRCAGAGEPTLGSPLQEESAAA